MIIKWQHRRIAGKSCQVLSTAYRWKHTIWHHGEIHGYGKKLNNRDNPQRSPKAIIIAMERVQRLSGDGLFSR